MKQIVSISLGSAKRDHEVEIELLGEKVHIQRIGTNGDMDKAIKMIKDLDGKVDAFGMGGIDLYIYAGARRYTLKDAEKIAEAAQKTPIVDGSGLKNTLERKVVKDIQEQGVVDFNNKRILMVSGVDRFGMAETFVQLGGRVTFGDLLFGLGIPIPITSIALFERMAKIIVPLISRLPFKYLYPTGEKQEIQVAKYARFYQQSDIIAGDFLFIRRYLPPSIPGKIIITNTVTSEDVELLKKTGASMLVTTTPELKGRSFGTNVMEALMISLINKPVSELTSADYNNIIERLAFKPRILKL